MKLPEIRALLFALLLSGCASESHTIVRDGQRCLKAREYVLGIPLFNTYACKPVDGCK